MRGPGEILKGRGSCRLAVEAAILSTGGFAVSFLRRSVVKSLTDVDAALLN